MTSLRVLLLLMILLVGCAKSAAKKQAEADECWLRYGSGRMIACLTAEHGWDSTSAYVAKIRRQNRGE